MAPYVPIHRRSNIAPPPHRINVLPPPPPGKTSVKRVKVLVVPKIHNKYVLVKNKKSGNSTFIGGGCGFHNNLKNCAHKELDEETKKSIKLNKINNYATYFTNKRRSPREQENNNKRGLNVTVYYYLFMPNISNKNFGKIKRNFNSFNTRTVTKNYNETSNIFLVPKNSLKNVNQKYFVMNVALNKASGVLGR